MKDLPVNERPQERLLKSGPESLSNAELLAVILRTGTKNRNVLDLCQQVLSEYSLKKLSRLSVSELKKTHGIGEAKACQIVSLFELSRRLESYTEEPKRLIKSPEDIFSFIYPKIREEKREKFIVLCLDTKNRVIREEVISIGSLNASIVHPREIFRPALMESAAAIVLIHNHPSGDPTPSPEDLDVTARIAGCGHLLGIEVLDHIIVGDGCFLSLKQEGKI
ncbi:RadC family protein [Methanolapillus millepedarum]